MRHLVWMLRISLLWGAVAVLTTLHMILEFAASWSSPRPAQSTISGRATSMAWTSVVR